MQSHHCCSQQRLLQYIMNIGNFEREEVVAVFAEDSQRLMAAMFVLGMTCLLAASVTIPLQLGINPNQQNLECHWLESLCNILSMVRQYDKASGLCRSCSRPCVPSQNCYDQLFCQLNTRQIKMFVASSRCWGQDRFVIVYFYLLDGPRVSPMRFQSPRASLETG